MLPSSGHDGLIASCCAGVMNLNHYASIIFSWRARGRVFLFAKQDPKVFLFITWYPRQGNSNEKDAWCCLHVIEYLIGKSREFQSNQTTYLPAEQIPSPTLEIISGFLHQWDTKCSPCRGDLWFCHEAWSIRVDLGCRSISEKGKGNMT